MSQISRGSIVATLYVQPNCAFCDQARQFLSENGIPWTERDVTKEPAAVEELRRIGTLATPVIVLGGKVIVGFNVEQLAEFLGE
jgi:arsenate reductase-like glutaredoxin family protein